MNIIKTDSRYFDRYSLSLKLLKNVLILTGLMLSGISMQTQANSHEQLTLNGLAAHWALGREYYVGALYLPKASSDPQAILAMNGPKRMEFKVTNEKWSPRRFAQMWNQAILINNSQENLNAMSDAIIAFTGLAQGNLIYGDQIFIDYTPGKGSKILLNGTVMFTTSEDGFFPLLLNTWIGRRPPSSDFKTAILSLQEDDETKDLLSRFEVIVPEKGRVAAVAGWSTVALAATQTSTAKAVKATPKPATKKTSTKAKPPKQAKAKTEPKKKATKTEKKTASNTTSSVAAATTVLAATAVTSSTSSAAPSVAAATSKPKSTPAPKAKPAPKSTKPSAASTKTKPQEPTKKASVEKVSPKATKTKKPTMTEAEKEQAKIRSIRNIYRANMLRLTYRYVIYPSRAINLNQEGTVLLNVTVNRKGKVLKIDHEEQSKYVSLNKAAAKAVKKATPYPAIPKQLPGDKFEFKVPIRFRIPK